MKKPNAENYRPEPAYIAEIISNTGMSQPTLAKRIGVHARTIRKWLAPAESPSHRDIPYAAQHAIEQLQTRKQAATD